jgi:uncharacterized protein YlbG (UPF0298 family)
VVLRFASIAYVKIHVKYVVVHLFVNMVDIRQDVKIVAELHYANIQS